MIVLEQASAWSAQYQGKSLLTSVKPWKLKSPGSDKFSYIISSLSSILKSATFWFT